MNKKDIVYRELNSAIKGILLITEGWLVGNSLHSIIHGNEVTDYDIIVPSRELFQKYIYLIVMVGLKLIWVILKLICGVKNYHILLKLATKSLTFTTIRGTSY